DTLAAGTSASFSVLGTATVLKITSAPVSTAASVSSSNITVQEQDAAGHGINATGGGQVVNLASNSGTGTFRDTGDTTTITSVTIPSGSSSASFKYKDTTIGTPTVSVSAGGFTGDSQQETVTTGSCTAIA